MIQQQEDFDLTITYPKYNDTYSDYISINYREKKEQGFPDSESFNHKVAIKTVNPAISTPWGFSVSGTQNSIYTSWGSSSGGDGGVKNYKVYINDANIGIATTASTSYVFNNLSYSTIYQVCVTAVDEKGNETSKDKDTKITFSIL